VKPIIYHLLGGILAVSCGIAAFVMLMILGQGKGGITEAVRWLFDEHQLLTASLIIGSILYAITWPWRMLRLMKKHDPGLLLYSKQVIYASLVMGTFFALIGLLVIIATFVDNRIGEQARFLMGMLTTPFLLLLLFMLSRKRNAIILQR